MDQNEPKLAVNPASKANIFSTLFFSWILPLLRQGRKKDLEVDDLYCALAEHTSTNLGSLFEKEWVKTLRRNSDGKSNRTKLWKTMRNIFWKKFILITLAFSVAELIIRPFQPILLRNFIRTFYSQEKDSERIANDIRKSQLICAALLVTVSVSFSIIFQTTVTQVLVLGMKCRLGVSSLVYKKILTLRKCDSEQANVGRLCNLLSSDVCRLDTSFDSLPFFFISPIQLAIYTWLLWDELGPSAFGGIGCIILFLPAQVLFGRFSMIFRSEISSRSDERGKFLNEIFGGIRAIKMYAWEKPFMGIVSRLRKLEMKFISRHLLMRGAFWSVYAISSKLVPFFSLILYVAMGNPLTADKAFFTITILNAILQTVVKRLADSATQLGDLISSLKRIEDFLLSPGTKKTIGKNLETNCYENTAFIEGNGFESIYKPRIKMDNFSTSWSKAGNPTLRNLSIDLMGSKLVFVVGHVGCGKTSFLNAILSEMPFFNSDNFLGKCVVSGSFSYASQEAWIFPATIRQNILFDLPMNEDRYWNTLRLCCLVDDLKQFPDADLTLVGERGVALSGGQKARINLARAVYQDADIYLLDDPLSSLDTRVGKRVFTECIQNHLEGKLRILVTHQLQYLPLADHIIVLRENGAICEQGTYDQLLVCGNDYVGSLISKENMKHASTNPVDVQEGKNKEESQPKLNCNRLTSKRENNTEELAAKPNVGGSMGFSIYYKYFKSGGSMIAVVFLVLTFLMTQLFYNGVDYWVSIWTKSATTKLENMNQNATGFYRSEEENYFANFYSVMMSVFVVLSIIRSIIFFRYCVKISTNLHNFMFRSVIRAPVKFFDDNPSGRIMNRFTKDLNQIDEYLPLSFYDFVSLFLILIGMLVLNIVANYYIAIPALILLLTLKFLTTFYLASARNLTRIEAMTKSPVFTHVAITVQGLTSIRALKAEKRMIMQFEKTQDLHTSAFYTLFMASRWFGFWLEVASCIFLSVVTFSFTLFGTSVDGGSVGMAISSIFGFSGGMQWGIRRFAETENFMTSVERVFEYCTLKPDALIENESDSDLPKSWPSQGVIKFRAVSLSYDDEENKVLQQISFSTEPKEKLGIVGRTGAGKSSVITALFRLTEICEGEITIDDVPIHLIGLHTLRSKISIIPQDPVLFTGTEVGLRHVVNSLEHLVADGGTNFSMGQRQLVCLARAILRKNRILVLDEATANVDPLTDQLIQRTIRDKFHDCTILTIAHRLQSILDNDRILVMNRGKIVEFDTPKSLMEDENSVFSAMLMGQHACKKENNTAH